MRDIIFLSHANPEDNEFTRWLALRLSAEGYPVWCDVAKLLGGEDFWKNIENELRERTVKLLYVLSRKSNHRNGTLKELALANGIAREEGLDDFVVPLSIDDLPHTQVNIELNRLISIPFQQGWAAGLNQLLVKLEEDNVPKNPLFSPSAVASWWRHQFGAEEGITDTNEEYLSSWFAVNELTTNVYFHVLFAPAGGQLKIESTLPYPAVLHNNCLVSFAKAKDFEGQFGDRFLIGDSHSYPTNDLLNGRISKDVISRKKSRDIIVELLLMAWNHLVESRNFPVYELANEKRCSYFVNGMIERDTITFKTANGNNTRRSMIGFKTVRKPNSREETKRYWHFGIQAKPLVYPQVAYCIKPHVLFSDDAINIWESKLRLHRARRSQCKNWWNSEWRDRIHAAMSWLSNDNETIELNFGSDVSSHLSRTSTKFNSPVSYEDPDKSQNIVLDIDDDEEYEDFGDGVENYRED